MFNLMFSEWRRFQRTVWIAAACHALALLFLSRATALLHRGYDDHGMMLAVYIFIALLLALVQVGSYRKPSQWLWLIHRPLPPARIFAALALSAIGMLAVGILLPLAGFVLATDLFTTQVVDSRHYGALLVVFAFTIMSWLAGAHAALSRHRATIAALVAPLLLALHLASVWSLLIPVLGCTVWLAWIALQGFRADRSAPISRPAVLILTALPLQLGFFLLLFQLSKVSVDVYQTMTQAAPGRTILETDVDVDVAAMIRRASQDFVSKGLERSDDPRATAWREQLPLLEVVDVTSALERFPVRHQVSNVSSSRWDATNGIEWTFSHDKMLFEGREPATGVRRGLWGTSGKDSEQVFREIPLGDMTASTLYAIDEERQQQHTLLSLEAGENFVSRPVRAADRLFVLSNRRLAAFVADRDANSPFAPPTLDWQVELSASDPRPVAVGVVELLDGWLVSAYRYAGPEYDGFEELVPHEQTIYYVESGSQAILVGRRLVEGAHITAGSAPAVPKASWWLSPALYAIGRLPAALLDTGRTRAPDYGLVPGPRLFYALAAGSLMLSLLLGAWWLRRTRPGAARRGWWLASCAVFGLPAFLSLVCLESRSAR